MLSEEGFNKDKVDSGEIGAGHSVVALYEISLANSSFKRLLNNRYANQKNTSNKEKNFNELGWLKLRYKEPNSDKSQLVEQTLEMDDLKAKSALDIGFSAAVAAFAQSLREDKYLNDFGYDDIMIIG